MEAVHQVVEFILAAGDERKRNDPTFREQDESALAHGEFVTGRLNFERLDEVRAQQLPRFNFQRIRFTIGFKAF
jgi:hypothetical protein